MSDAAAMQLRRILQLIPRLADGDEHSIDDIAQAAGTSRREIVSDLESICTRFDAPGGFVDGVSVMLEHHRVSVHANHFHRPMRLTMPELCALELGLTLLRSEKSLPEANVIDRALARLRETISQLPENERFEAVHYAEIPGDDLTNHLSSLRQAILNNHRIVLEYRSGGSVQTVRRTGSPNCLVFAEQMWYVVATGDDGTYRFFRLDRIESVEILQETFDRDESVVTRVLQSGRAFASGTDRRLRVRYAASIARWVAEREGVPLDADGSLTLDHILADDAWAVRHVLQYGSQAEVLAPLEIRELLASQLQVFMTHSIFGASLQTYKSH